MAAKVKDNNMINESYREIRTYLTINDEMKTILVTSAEMNEGKTTTICNLAKCFGEFDDIKVILIDCDLRKEALVENLESVIHLGFRILFLEIKNLMSVFKKWKILMCFHQVGSQTTRLCY